MVSHFRLSLRLLPAMATESLFRPARGLAIPPPVAHPVIDLFWVALLFVPSAKARGEFVAAVYCQAKARGFHQVLAVSFAAVRSWLELGSAGLLAFGSGRFRVCFERVIAAAVAVAVVVPAPSAAVVDLATRTAAAADFDCFADLAFRCFATSMAGRAKGGVAVVARAFSSDPRSFSLHIHNSPSPLCSAVRP